MRTVCYVVIQAASHNRKEPSDVPPFARLGNASHNSHSFHDARAPSVDDSVKSNGGISSNDVAGRFTLKDDSRTKTGNSAEQRTLKFRIKMNSNILVKKNAEIYSGLGLDDSPSSSMGNSPAESEGNLPVSQQKAEDSPTSIIQVSDLFLFIHCSIQLESLNCLLFYFNDIGYDFFNCPWGCSNITST